MSAKKNDGVKQAKARIVIVDDHPIVREHLAQLINQATDMTVCGQAADAPQALKVIDATKPDMAIVDLSLQNSPGLDLIKDIRATHPRLPVLVLSMHDESRYAERALRAGAKGYIMKQEATEQIMTAIRRVLSGEIFVSESLAEAMVHRFSKGRAEIEAAVARLTDRELEIFERIGQGQSRKQIAGELHLSIKTVETHCGHIMQKLELPTSFELVKRAAEWVQGD